MSSMIAVSNGGSYGAFELKKLYPKYYTAGITAAVTIHLLVLVIYLLSGSERKVNVDVFDKNVRVIDLEIFKAPSLLKYIPEDGALISNTAIHDGIPVPVLNNKADLNATIKSIEERRSDSFNEEILKDGEVLAIKYPPAKIIPPELLPGENDFVPVEKIPEQIVAPEPEYPAVAVNAGIVGKVFVKILVGKEGKVLKAFVIKSDSELLNQAALDASLKSVFSPAIQNNHPVAVWIVLHYSFKLRE